MNRESQAKYGGYFGIALNAVLFITKLLFSIVSGSVALRADAFNNLMDMASSFTIVIGFLISSQKADETHPFGHGRMEYISGLIISLIICYTGIELIKSSIIRILNPSHIEINAGIYIVLILSALLKFCISAYNYRLGKKIDSMALIVNAKDSAGDVLISIFVLFSIALSPMFSFSLDGYGGLLLSIFILSLGIKAFRSMLSPLLGENLSYEKRMEIKQFVEENPFFKNVHDIALHSYGYSSNILTLHVEADADNSLIKAHEEVDALEQSIKQKFGYIALVHLDPVVCSYKNWDSLVVQRRELLEKLLNDIDKSLSYHDFRSYFKDGKEFIRFDVYVPFSVKKSNKELKHNIIKLLMQHLDKSTKYHVDIVRTDL